MKPLFLSILSLFSVAVLAQDVTPPVAICKNITVYLDRYAYAAIAAEDLDNGSYDDDAIGGFSTNLTDFDCSYVNTTTIVTLTVTDASGNMSTCDAEVFVRDTILPLDPVGGFAEATLDDLGNVFVSGFSLAIDVDESCLMDVQSSKTDFTCDDIGENIVELTFIDVAGNTATTTATVVVLDLLAPTALCKNISVELSTSGTSIINAGDLDNGSTDQCAVAGFEASQTSFTAANIGDNIVTLTVTDVNGNASTCDATVTITQSVDITTLLSSYTIISLDAASFKRNTVSSGGIGVTKSGTGGKVTLDMNSVVTAATTFVKASVIDVRGGSVVTEKILARAELTLPVVQANPYSGTKNLTVADNATVTSNDSIFGTIQIGKNAIVTFTRPRIYAKSYEARESSTVNFASCTQVAVTDFVKFKKKSKTNTDLKNVTFHVKNNKAGNEFTFEAGAVFNGNAYTTTGEMVTLKASAAAPTILNGQFIAKKITADEYTTWSRFTGTDVCAAPSFAPAQPAASARMAPTTETEEKKGFEGAEIFAFPNPFNAVTNIRFTSSAAEKARLTIYSISGAEVQTLFEGNTEPGNEYNFQFDGSNQPAGIYFYRLETNGKTYVNKLLLTK